MHPRKGGPVLQPRCVLVVTHHRVGRPAAAALVGELASISEGAAPGRVEELADLRVPRLLQGLHDGVELVLGHLGRAPLAAALAGLAEGTAASAGQSSGSKKSLSSSKALAGVSASMEMRSTVVSSLAASFRRIFG